MHKTSQTASFLKDPAALNSLSMSLFFLDLDMAGAAVMINPVAYRSTVLPYRMKSLWSERPCILDAVSHSSCCLVVIIQWPFGDKNCVLRGLSIRVEFSIHFDDRWLLSLHWLSFKSSYHRESRHLIAKTWYVPMLEKGNISSEVKLLRGDDNARKYLRNSALVVQRSRVGQTDRKRLLLCVLLPHPFQIRLHPR